MILNKNHREHLLKELQNATEALFFEMALLQTDKEKNEIKNFIIEARINLIIKSLINNKIDF